ncbi:MAG: DUF2975 domain-containing protein [Paraclostridium sp.]|uniref:DUF2975 domain-containing protein n=1 Tax=Paraclostridium sp. TaxID=2023273 RepID=UPI003EE531AC
MNSKLVKRGLSLFLYLTLVFLSGGSIYILFQKIPELMLTFDFSHIVSLIMAIIYMGNYILVNIFLIGIIESTDYTPFVFANVKRFKKMGYCLFVNAIIECILGYSLNKNASIQFIGTENGAITRPMIICIVAALMFFVIGEVFDKAIKLKEDNDLTV